MRLWLAAACLLATAVAVRMDSWDVRKEYGTRSKFPSRSVYDGSRRVPADRSSSSDYDRHELQDRKELDRKLSGPRAVDEDRSEGRAQDWQRRAAHHWDRAQYEDRREEADRWDQDRWSEDDREVGPSRRVPPSPRHQWHTQRAVPGEPPSRAVPGSPPFRGYDLQSRGINWETSHRGEFQFIARLSAYYTKSGAWYYEPCGASIISPVFLLTAAHCFDHQRAAVGHVDPARVYAYLNDFDTTQPDESAIVTASEVILHDNYTPRGGGRPLNDVAVVRLSSPLDFAALGVGSICLDSAPIGDNVDMTIAGWGKTAENAAHMNTQLFKSTNEKTLSLDRCKYDTSYSPDEIDSDAICASGANQLGVQDACQGDSGGPMFHQKNGQFAQTGVVSWGRGCGRASYPGVYARVSKFANWVVAKTNGAAATC
ncbi:phenoloxidase-activating factor 2-like [Amphibalanus amphitrite]|uniref:phenoloxidase-activating factor 2-like n=1 Tax=Amphibalanus amphitrite TaxID=1232801 RepID=UPI001C9253D5|nr:phenoloxidase-activating factor 2-like [Amphibalanus amphitrite]